MTNSNRKVSVLWGALGVAALALEALAGAAVPEHRHPLITAPWLEQAPRVDGLIEKAEWLRAAQGLPLIDRNTARLTEDLTVYWVGYTEDALHLAFRVNRPLYALAPSPADRIEFFVQPGEQGPDYWFCLHADGVTREGIRHQTTDQGWSPPWRHALQATETGWEGELSIPFASLDLAGAPAPGAVWRLLVVDQRLTPAGEQAFSSWLGDGGAWPAKQNMGRLRFGAPAEPAIRSLAAGPVNPAEAGILLEAIGGAGSAALRFEAGVYRATGAATQVQDSGAGGDIWIPVTAELNFFQLLETGGLAGALEYYEPVEEWAVDLEQEAGVARRFPWLTAAAPGNYVLLYRALDRATGEVLAVGTLPFVQQPAFAVEIVPHLITSGTLSIRADYRRMTVVPEGGRIVAELRDAAAQAALARADQAVDSGRRRTVLSLPAAGLFEREISVRTALLDAAGQSVAEDIQPLTLPARPEWLGWNAGPGADEVLPPWTPIALENETAEIVLRRIRFGANSFPAEIRSRDRELLAGPMRLTLDGREPEWTRQLEASGPAQVRWVSRARQAGIEITVQALLEYDGMLRYDLTLDPGAEPRALRELVLHIPYNRAATLLTEDVAIREFQLRSELHDMETGLQWFAEWAQGWQIGAEPVFEMKAAGDTVDWTIRMIGIEGKTIAEPLTLTFGMIPTPVRELDLSYNVTHRHTHPFGGPAWNAEQATMTLTYPVAGQLEAEAGTILFRANWYHNATRLLQLGRGRDSVNLYFIRSTLNQYGRSLWLTRGEAEIASDRVAGDFERLGALDKLITPSTAWQALALSWQRHGDTVRLEVNALEPPADQARGFVADIPWDFWQRVLAQGEFRFGGGGDLALDLVAAGRTVFPAGTLAARLASLPHEADDAFTLVDPLDTLRLHQGKYLSRPVKSAAGRGGLAGGPYSGLLVEPVESAAGRGLLLPAGERTRSEVMKAYGMTMYMPIHEEFHHHTGFYTVEHMESPVLRQLHREIHAQGLGVMMYGGFGFEARDHYLAGVRQELLRLPERPTFSGALPCLNTPAADYYGWHWQRNIEYYGALGGMYDNTAHAWVCNSLEHGCGWVDDHGELQGRAPLFGAREVSKRLRWLWHVHRTKLYGEPGLYSLHAGARGFWAVSGFADVIKFGEGWMMGTEFTLYEPETGWREGWQWRVGVPGELLPKQEFMFSQNYVMLYALLYNQPFRLYGSFLDPAWWHVNTANPAASRRSPGAFNPYYAEKGVPNFAAPHALWWQVQDDFDTWTAAFHPFWRNQESVQLNHPKLRSSFHLHVGQRALFVVSNFHEEAVAAELTLALERFGLAGQALEVWDAFTGEAYPLDGNKISLTIPAYQYRLIRVEGVGE